MSNPEKRDLVLDPNSFVCVQDTSTSQIRVHTGPTVINPTPQEKGIVYDQRTKSFRTTESLKEAVQTMHVVPEGWYATVLNPVFGPTGNLVFPKPKVAEPAQELTTGRKVQIPGHTSFSLWPGQCAEVVRGHQLNKNQYLEAFIYNEEEALKNWGKAIVRSVGGEEKEPEATTQGDDKSETKSEAKPSTSTETLSKTLTPPEFTTGKRFIIKGTEVSFFIPPTGISIVPVNPGADIRSRVYVREATSLENLEYCILVNQDGKKRYENGPQVVFPEPTERFVEGKNDNGEVTRKFRAIELEANQGIYIKVVSDYTDESGKQVKAGEELFIRGSETKIYYPREEHNVVREDGRVKYVAVAIPEGQARYVMDKTNSAIEMVKGPRTLLPDPRKQTLIRRVLSDKQVTLWYPGNYEAQVYNQNLRELRALSNASPGRGAVPEETYERATRGGLRSRGGSEGLMKGASAASFESMEYSTASNQLAMGSSHASREQNVGGRTIDRSTVQATPHSVILDDKYQGAPSIEVHVGYAVKVISKTGQSRIVKGGESTLLGYDEKLAIMQLSTGKPKTTDRLLETVYLKTSNNGVSDYVEVESQDHVKVRLYVRYMVDFEGDPNKWFSIENYVKHLCDHARSVLKGRAQTLDATDLYRSNTAFVRDTILGLTPEADPTKTDSKAKRPGMLFPENGMRVYDVEVLGATFLDDEIRKLLETSQREVIFSSIEIEKLERNFVTKTQKEEIAREEAKLVAETAQLRNRVEIETAESKLALILANLGNELKQIELARQLEEKKQQLANFTSEAERERLKANEETRLEIYESEQQLKIDLLKAEAESVVNRLSAMAGGMSEALLSLSNNKTLVEVAQAMNVQRVIGGDSIADAFSKAFKGTALESIVDKALSVRGPLSNGNGHTQHAPTA